MSSNDLNVGIKIYADARQFGTELKKARGKLHKFSLGVKKEFAAIRKSISSIKGQMASLGLAIGATAAVMKSARLDKNLIQIQQTAGASKKQVEGLRYELFGMATETGQQLEDLSGGFNNLIQAGLTWSKAMETIKAINPAMAVTGSKAHVLASGLTVAAEAFDFDLSKQGMAVKLLDQMTVAGRLGNAELEDLSSIFARVGINAKSANLSFSETLGFIEQLSLTEKQPERLATLVDSTLRLFTNKRYQDRAQENTGVQFYDGKGDRRAALDVLSDIAKNYKTLKSDISRDETIQAAFGQADLDTIKGLRKLLSGNTLSGIGKLTKEIEQAGGTIQKDLTDAINNSVDQVGRLKTALRKAADDFSRPINDAISKTIKYGLNKKEQGGLGLSGKEMILGGGAIIGGGILAGRYGGKLIRSITGSLGGVAGGVAAGKVLEETAGVQSVFVVNMPTGFAGAPGGIPIPKGAGSFIKGGAMATVAGAVGYGVGSLIHKAIEGTAVSNAIGKAIAQGLAMVGNKEAKISLEIDAKGQARVQHMQSNGLEIDVGTGHMGAGA